MENDAIRSSGSNTLVDIWVNGKMRAIVVSQEAIGAFLGFDRTGSMTADDRCEFVRTNLPLVVTAAKARLRELDDDCVEVVLAATDLPRRDGETGERRKTDRRSAERRKLNVPRRDQPERRRGDRRQGQRRTRAPKKKES
jgi:hypothetical protein